MRSRGVVNGPITPPEITLNLKCCAECRPPPKVPSHVKGSSLKRTANEWNGVLFLVAVARVLEFGSNDPTGIAGRYHQSKEDRIPTLALNDRISRVNIRCPNRQVVS